MIMCFFQDLLQKKENVSLERQGFLTPLHFCDSKQFSEQIQE